ncbi:helix-turn-helix domain-containing protein [Duganella sp. BuS-21]|uniref:helix-turn-helix domain-containing protein n=1 Tax=Duganella sp. BuS-21 TaxID=2943848 RepID=UPI0035A6201B
MNSEWAESPQEQGSTGKTTPGALLAAQREAMGWTVEQIAEQLKLAVRQVKALEAGDYAALPNMAVTRGFVRAYAKVLKMDAAPLVAMIEMAQPGSPEVAVAPRKDLAASFSESRFPSMTGRSSGPAGWLVGLAAVVVVGAAGAYAYQTGLIPASLFERKEEEAKPAEAPAIETTLVKPGEEASTLQSPNVPLISVPPQGEQGATTADAVAPASATPPPAPVAAAPVAPAVPAQTAPAATAAAAPAPAASTGQQLVLKVSEDSWVEIRRPGTTALISRVVKAGSTETFDIKDPALLIVGKPGGVQATLGGAPLALPTIPGGTISRVNIK